MVYGMRRYAAEQWSPRTRSNWEIAQKRKTLSPRIKRAIELYESGAVKTKREAAETVGLSRYTLTKTIAMTPVAQEYAESLSGEIQTKVVDLSAVIERLSAKALDRVAILMDRAGKEDVQLRAAQDILDRNPKTSKTSRVTVDKLSLTGRDVEALTRAITMGRSLKEAYPEATAGDYTPALEAGDGEVG